MLTRNERPSGRILLATNEIPAEYHVDRLRWWTINSPSWSTHIDADQNRNAMLAKLAQKAVDLIGPKQTPVVADLGCGEGAFLRALGRLAPAASLLGIDFCPAMLGEAKRRAADQCMTFTLGDLEEPGFAAPSDVDLVTSILAMDEMDQLEVAFRNIARALVPGGVALLVVMDPVREMERNRGDLASFVRAEERPDDAVLLVKTFPTAPGVAPAAPYSRIVRPLSQYLTAARAADLQPAPVEQWAHTVGVGVFSDTLLFDVMVFRKVDRAATMG